MSTFTPDETTHPYAPPAIEVVATAAEECDALAAADAMTAGVRR
jgi:hypothetical protein